MAELKELAAKKLATVAGVNFNVTTKSSIFTVPPGKSCIITHMVTRAPSISLTTASWGFGFNANADDVVTSATHTGLDGATKYALHGAKDASVRGAAADVFGVRCSVAQGAAATVTIDVFGYLF